MLAKLIPVFTAVAIACSAAPSLSAQESANTPEKPVGPYSDREQAEAAKFSKLVDSLDWKTEGSGTLGSIAALKVPAGYRFTGGTGTIALMKAYGNLTSNEELGYVSPLDMRWFAVFEFDPCGYVKDDEKDKLDADKILKELKAGQEEANKELSKRGMPSLQVVGWQTPPFYNPQTKNLEWAIRIRSSDGGDMVNYKTKLLGRRGVMDVVLVCDEAQMSEVVTAYQEVLKGFAFNKEESYAAFTKGDKIAEYGLTGLIVGGGLLVAAKSGLLAKLWKPIVVGVVAIGAFLKRIFVGKTKETI